MALGRKTGGRKKGSLNKSPVLISEICAQECFDPVRFMIRTAKNPRVPIQTRLDAASKLLPYLHAKPVNPQDIPQGTLFEVNIVQAGSRPEIPPQLPVPMEALDIKVNRL
jgi:hypothetical protein